MQEKELKIIPPEGYEVDEENSTFKCIKYKEILDKNNKLPKTWKEAYTEYTKDLYYISTNSYIGSISGLSGSVDEVYNKNILISKERYEEVLAFIQLLFLRDIYRDNWTPSIDNKLTYIIGYNKARNEIEIESYSLTNKCLSFQSKELRDLFLENFRDLIEKVKYLI